MQFLCFLFGYKEFKDLVCFGFLCILKRHVDLNETRDYKQTNFCHKTQQVWFSCKHSEKTSQEFFGSSIWNFKLKKGPN